MQASPGKLAAELSETLTQCATFTVLKLLTRTPNPPQAPILPPAIILGGTRGTPLKKTSRTRGQEPTLPAYSPDSVFDDVLG